MPKTLRSKLKRSSNNPITQPVLPSSNEPQADNSLRKKRALKILNLLSLGDEKLDWTNIDSGVWMSAEILQAIGILGFLFYMAGFAGLQIGLIDGNGMTYTLLNILGASFVLISLLGAFNLASLLIQVSWICIGIYGIFRQQRETSKTPVFTRRDAPPAAIHATERQQVARQV